MNPALGRTIKMLVRHSNPHGGLNTIHSEIIFCECTPGTGFSPLN
jgi:hypothetical protein